MPEFTTTDPESSDGKDPSFSDDAIQLIDQSTGKSHQEQLNLAEGFLNRVDELAGEGKIIGSEGTIYSAQDIKDRLVQLVDQFNNPATEKLDDPLILIPRSSGLRDAINSLLLNEGTAESLLQAIKDRRGNPFQHGTGYEGARGDEPVNDAWDTFNGLSPEAQAEVLNYQHAVKNKRDAEKEKNFALAAEDKRVIHRIKQSLSPEARDFLFLDEQ